MCIEDHPAAVVRARRVLSKKDKVTSLVALTGLHSCRIAPPQVAVQLSNLQNILLTGFQTTTELSIAFMRRWLRSEDGPTPSTPYFPARSDLFFNAFATLKDNNERAGSMDMKPSKNGL